MAIDAHDGPAPVVLVGETTENWSGDARYYEYSAAADPVGSGAISRVPVERFPAAVHEGPGTRLVPLDLSAALDVPYPATSPALLAAFVVLDPDSSLTTAPDATSELLYVLEGTGRTEFTRMPVAGDVPGSSLPGGTIDWGPGDVVTLPAGCSCSPQGGPRRTVPPLPGDRCPAPRVPGSDARTGPLRPHPL